MQNIKLVFDQSCNYWEYDEGLSFAEMLVMQQLHYIQDQYLANGYIYEDRLYELFGAEWCPYNENRCIIRDRDGDLLHKYTIDSENQKIEITWWIE